MNKSDEHWKHYRKSIFLLAQHIVEAANVSLNMKLNPVMAVSLADHLFYAIQRFRKELQLQIALHGKSSVFIRKNMKSA